MLIRAHHVLREKGRRKREKELGFARDSGDHRIPGSLQLRPLVEILFYWRRQLQVHKEVLLEGKTFLVVHIVEESTREIVGE